VTLKWPVVSPLRPETVHRRGGIILTPTILLPPLGYQSFKVFEVNKTAHGIILCDTLYNRLPTNAV